MKAYSVSYGGRRGGFKMSAASKGTSKQSATKMPICMGETADLFGFGSSLGAEVEACRFSKYSAYS